MENETTEFSFVLKPSEYGVGVFAAHDIKQGTYLRLFGHEQEEDKLPPKRKPEEVPEFFQQYCLEREGFLYCPADFGAMPVGWYLNHSTTPNADHDAEYKYHALRDIKAGEEITIDYNSLEEPEEKKADYYRKEN